MSAAVRTMTYALNVWNNLHRIVAVRGEHNGRRFSEVFRAEVRGEAPTIQNALSGAINAYRDAEARGVEVPRGTALAAIRQSMRALDRARELMVREMGRAMWDELNKPGLVRFWESLPADTRAALRREFPNLAYELGKGLGFALVLGVGLWALSKWLGGGGRS